MSTSESPFSSTLMAGCADALNDDLTIVSNALDMLFRSFDMDALEADLLSSASDALKRCAGTTGIMLRYCAGARRPKTAAPG